MVAVNRGLPENARMNEVETLLSPRGRVAILAREMKVHPGTVWEWKTKRAIPKWRRVPVLNAVRRLKIDVPPEVVVYLAQAE